MTHRISLSPRAERDLVEIWFHTANRWSEAEAERYLRGLRDLLDLLAAYPDIARPRREFTIPARLHPYRSHMVIFIFTDEMLEVVRVVHARSNWSMLLAE